MLFDTLLREGKREDFEKHLGRLSAIDFTGTMLAAISGGVLANFFDLEFNYILSIGSMSIAFFITLLLKEPPMRTAPESELSCLKHAKQAVEIFKKNPFVFVYYVTGAVLGACLIYLDEFWQIVLENISVSVIFFGAVSAFSSILRIPGNLFAYKLKEKFKYNHIFTCTICVCLVGYAAIFFINDLWCLVPMMLIFMISSIVDPLVMGYMHRHTQSNIRATVESVSSLGLRIVSIVVGLFFGYVSSEYSIFAGFLVLSLICLVYLILFGITGHYFRKDAHIE